MFSSLISISCLKGLLIHSSGFHSKSFGFSEGDPQICNSRKFSGDVDAFGLGTTL